MPQAAPLEVGLMVSDGAPRFDAARLISLIQSAAAAEGARGEIGIWICSDAEIAELHRRYMNDPAPTDVLSFTGDRPYLGDIAVSFETAELQAREVDHSVQREIAYLVLHGLLHLLGYDDLTPSDRERMLARQDALICSFEMDFPDEC